jgi:predicted DsbA family dithiol-disulfide isomerase
MNVHVPPKARLVIEVVHDLVCPWCYLGVQRLLRTLHRRPDIATTLAWHPFLLNPDMPRLGMARSDYVVRKFGGEGLTFRFERIRRTPSSVDAHRLVRFAARDGRADEMAMALFAAHFTEGLDIGDIFVLTALAGSAGLDMAAARDFLESDAEFDAIHAENLRAHRLGINGVPCFVLGGRHAIAGAQEAEVIARLLDVALLED